MAPNWPLSHLGDMSRCTLHREPETLSRRQTPRMRIGINQHQQPNVFPTIGQALGHFQCHLTAE